MKSEASVLNASSSTPEFPSRHVVPAMDVFRRPGSWRLDVEIPGARMDDLDLHVEGAVLTLVAPRSDRPALTWKRQVRLPEGVDPSRIEARWRRGVLQLNLPDAEETGPIRVPVLVEER